MTYQMKDRFQFKRSGGGGQAVGKGFSHRRNKQRLSSGAWDFWKQKPSYWETRS